MAKIPRANFLMFCELKMCNIHSGNASQTAEATWSGIPKINLFDIYGSRLGKFCVDQEQMEYGITEGYLDK